MKRSSHERQHRGWIVCLLLMLVCGRAFSNPTEVIVSGGFTQLALGPYWQIWEDKDVRGDFDALPPLNEWSASQQDMPSMGFSDSAFWFHTRIYSTLLWRQTVYLQIDNPLLSEVEVVWQPEGSPPQNYQVGLHYPFSARAIAHRHFIFPLILPAKGSGDLWMRVRSQTSVQVPANLMMPAALMRVQEHSAMWLGVALGVPAIMLCYNLLLYLMVRERSYLLFSLHALSALLFLVVLQGFSAQHVFPENPHWRAREVAVMVLLATFFSNLFAEYYLGLKRRQVFLYSIFRGVRFLCGALLLVVWFLPEVVSNVIAMLLASLSALCISITVLSSFAGGGRTVRIFCIGWLVLIAGVLLLALNKIGFVVTPLLAEHALLAGFAIEMSMIAFALADRLNTERYLKLHAQETALHHAERERQARERMLTEEREAQRALNEAVQVQRTQHHTLEQQVLERTQAMEEAHQRLLALYEEDPLTALKNRRYFAERLTDECKRARQLKQTLAVLLIDLDHFKRINDQFGHLTGDQCIRHLAGLLSACFNRAGDCVARYGGEEFAVLMPQCELSTAQWVAENLRQKVEQRPAIAEGETITMTVSIGLVVFVPDDKHEVDHYLQLADEALYRAKSTGRNSVCHVVEGLPV